MTKEHFENRVKKYIANAKTLDAMDAKQAEAINELEKTLDHVVSMLRECSDLYMSDVNKLERGYNLLRNSFDTEPTEWELEKFAEYDIQWPPKSKTKAKES
tara:strand:+ start:1694 stop:1996 length:303 start_codon:yes stop_codon:yes gene_type:complete